MRNPASTFLLGLALGFTVSVVGAQLEPKNLGDQVIRNTQHLVDVDRQLAEVNRWREEHTSSRSTENTLILMKLAQLEVTVQAHEKLIWAIATAVILTFVGGIFSLVNQATIKKSMNTRLDEMLTERGPREHATGHREGMEGR